MLIFSNTPRDAANPPEIRELSSCQTFTPLPCPSHVMSLDTWMPLWCTAAMQRTRSGQQVLFTNDLESISETVNSETSRLKIKSHKQIDVEERSESMMIQRCLRASSTM